MKTHAIRIHETGGPEKMRWEEIDVGQPGQGEVTLRNHACGLNYIDTYHRTGLYPIALPSGLGLEGAGVVEALGAGRQSQGRRSGGHCAAPIGAYAELRNYPVDKLIKIRSCRLQDRRRDDAGGMTGRIPDPPHLSGEGGDWVLFHAAAGGSGRSRCNG